MMESLQQQERTLVCGGCGYKNPAGHRFCGMCGTPLPQAPLTAPGAASTVAFTRIPLERPQPRVQETATPQPSPSDVAQQENEPSLEQFVAGFRYEPPDSPLETTMHGDASPLAVDEVDSPAISGVEPPVPRMVDVSDAQPPASTGLPDSPDASLASTTPVAAPTATSQISAASPAVQQPPANATPSPTEEGPSRRPGFLDFSDATERRRERVPGGASIVGPSFLGLSDDPEIAEELPGAEEETPRTSGFNWRVTLALLLLIALGVLGYMQWRSQENQSNNGPLDVLKMQWQKVRHGRAAETPPAAETNPGNNSQPDMQVEPQQKTQPPEPAAPSSNPSSPNNPPGPDDRPAGSNTPAPLPGVIPAPASANAATSGASQLPSATSAAGPQGGGNARPANTANTPAVAQNAVPSRRIAASQDDQEVITRKIAPKQDDQEVITRKIAPGQDEMNRAANASDSAAAAAWLWKATAKGNLEAPVQLADLYIKGDGVPRDCDQAIVLLRSAANRQNAPARNRLASMYENGVCVSRNRVEAYRWLSAALAVDPSSQWAQQNQSLVWSQMTPTERAQAGKYGAPSTAN